MTKNSKVDKYIYYFLKYVDLKDFWTAFHYLQNKYKLEEDYVSLIVSECIDSKYINSASFHSSIVTNEKLINVCEHVYVTRLGYNFVTKYRTDKINFYWIPFKNLIIILVTAIITASITTFINKISTNISYSSNTPENQHYQDINVIQE